MKLVCIKSAKNGISNIKKNDFIHTFSSWSHACIEVGSSLSQNSKASGARISGCCMKCSSAPGIPGIQALDFIAIEQVFQKFCIVPQCRLMQQSEKITKLQLLFYGSSNYLEICSSGCHSTLYYIYCHFY